MQIARDVTSGSLPNVWRPFEKALIISLHWFTEPFILFVHMQWKTRTRTCFSEESRLLAACHTENDRLSRLNSLLLGNRMERECICLRGGNTARAVGNVPLTRRLILAQISKPCRQAKHDCQKQVVITGCSTHDSPGNCTRMQNVPRSVILPS